METCHGRCGWAAVKQDWPSNRRAEHEKKWRRGGRSGQLVEEARRCSALRLVERDTRGIYQFDARKQEKT
ncbi:MAG: hypothetical protein PHI97_04335 [Desulfobulbus sp.]|nr:hypothetical protein [Desulfobulbus sp.]